MSKRVAKIIELKLATTQFYDEYDKFLIWRCEALTNWSQYFEYSLGNLKHRKTSKNGAIFWLFATIFLILVTEVRLNGTLGDII